MTRAPYTPTFDGASGTGPVGEKGQIELTARFALIVPSDVAHEIPYGPNDNPQWWSNQRWNFKVGRYEPAGRVCDGDHYLVDLNQGRGIERSIMWWICGGSDTYMTSPREWDPRSKFILVPSPGVTLKYPCWRKDNFNACVWGTGTIRIDAPADLYVCAETLDRDEACPSGRIPLPAKNRGNTRAVNVAAPTPKPTRAPR